MSHNLKFVYHRTHQHGRFEGTYYRTAKKNAQVGDEIFVLSGDRPRSGQGIEYFVEGKFQITRILDEPDGRKRLLLGPLNVPAAPAAINGAEWFDNKEFHNYFTAGQSLNPVPTAYVKRFEGLLAADPTLPLSDGALSDLPGAEHADRALTVGVRYKRDPAVRKAVMDRAGGKCEFCGVAGFDLPNGKRYLESHHIIALADDGADRLTNVIALCANDHREAHFGQNREELEKRMAARVAAMYPKI